MSDASTRLVLTSAVVYSYRFPFSTSVIIDGGRVAWIGDDAGLSGQLLPDDEHLDCEGALITPAFFDAHREPGTPDDVSVGAAFFAGPDGLTLATRTNDGLAAAAEQPEASPFRIDESAVGVPDAERLAGDGRFVVLPGTTDPEVLGQLAAAGVPFAFGTFGRPGDQWEWIRSAVFGGPAGISARAAFNAATRAGWRLANRPEEGEIAIGSTARFNLWRCDDLEVQTPDERIRAWSTDVRAGTPPLPDVRPDARLPQLWGTLHSRRFRLAG